MGPALRVMCGLLVPLVPLQAENSSMSLRLETKTIPGGTELITVFSQTAGLVNPIHQTE